MSKRIPAVGPAYLLGPLFRKGIGRRMDTANLPTQRFGGLRAWLMAFFYDRFLAQPEAHGLGDWRRALIQPLTGVVVEIGAGTGVNLSNYGDVSQLLLTEPDPHMRSQLVTKLQARPELVATVSDAPAEQLPCGDHSVDAVVCTLVLCSVFDPAVVLAEIRRVLKPGGQLIFLEHVGSDDPASAARPGRDRLEALCG